MTDFKIIGQLWQTEYSVWLAITLISVAMPIFVSYVPFLLYLKERIVDDRKFRLIFVAWIMVSPIAPVLLLLMDLVFEVTPPSQLGGITLWNLRLVLWCLLCVHDGETVSVIMNKWSFRLAAPP